MLLHFDLVYAGENARFALPFVNLGLCPEAGSSFLIPRLAGHQQAAELLLLGEPFSAEKARAIGLVNAVYPDEQVFDKALEAVLKLAQKPPAALRLTKSLIKRAASDAVAQTMAVELAHFNQRLVSAECREALGAFLERKKPDFSSFE
jgi:enoyl-CoA hydratase/carnithine racemase